MSSKKIAVMQPYFLPYLGYFQLVSAVDTFIFYDDVQFIKGGWINRNSILSNQQPYLLSVPLVKASSNKSIQEIQVNKTHPSFHKGGTTLLSSYAKAPFSHEINPLLKEIYYNEKELISEFAANSIILIAEFLGLKTKFKFSSTSHAESRDFERSERLLDMVKKEGGNHYINSYGGRELYDKANFQRQGIQLSFIKMDEDYPSYDQQSPEFYPNLSIIDLLMFCGKEGTLDYLQYYKLL